MTAVDTQTASPAPEPADASPSHSTDLWIRVPRAVRMVAYVALGVGVLSLSRVITDAGQLTAEGTFRSALQLSIPIALAGLGGLWAERAGVVNIGLEGMMVLGTWFGAWGALTYGSWQGVAIGVLGGAVGGLLHAVATVGFGVDHIISGVAINLLGVGVTDFLTTTTWEGATRESPQFDNTIPNVDLVPFLEAPLRELAGQGRFFLSDLSRMLLAFTTSVSMLVVIALALFPITWYLLWKTPLGLRLRSAGEDPDAADSLGVKVYGVKYLAVTVSGALAGLGGVSLVYLFSERFQSGQTGGRGFIGLAAMIFGNWMPGTLLAGAGLFGFMDSMQSQVDATAHALLVVGAMVFLLLALRSAVARRWRSTAVLVAFAAGFWLWYANTDELPREMIPYFPHITTLVVLAFASQRLRMPAADGKIWRRSGK
jgi:simple sugar transport system permease protein